MNPGAYDLDIYRGDTKRWRFRLWVDVARTQPIDLTNVVILATIRDKTVGGTYVVLLDCVAELPNIVDMTLTATKSRSLPATGFWDLQLTYPSGDVFTPLTGTVVVTQDVTQTGLVATPYG